MSPTPGMNFRSLDLLPLDRVRPTEETDPDRVAALARKIARDGFWTDPLRVEKRHAILMDGHHRLAAAGRLGLVRVPCVAYGYGEVSVESRRPEFRVDPAAVIRRGLERRPFPPKTTRHRFPDIVGCRIALKRLMGAGIDALSLARDLVDQEAFDEGSVHSLGDEGLS